MEIYRKNINIYSKTTNSPKAFGFFFVLFGAAFIIVASAILIRREVFKNNAIRTTGVVVANVTSEGSSGYKTRYSYFDEEGNEYINTGNSSSNPPEFTVGASIPVYYSISNHEKSIYIGSTDKFIFIVFFALGGISFIAGLIVFILNRDKEVVWEESGLLARKKKDEEEE